MRRTVLGRRGAPLWRPDLACGIERRLRRPLALSPAPDGTLRVPPVANPRRTSPPVRVRAPVPAPAQDRVQAAEAGGEAPDEGRAREGPAEPWVGTRRPQEARDPPARRGPRARAVPPRSWACYGGPHGGTHGGLPRRRR